MQISPTNRAAKSCLNRFSAWFGKSLFKLDGSPDHADAGLWSGIFSARLSWHDWPKANTHVVVFEGRFALKFDPIPALVCIED